LIYLFYFSVACRGQNDFTSALYLYDPITQIENQQAKLISYNIKPSTTSIIQYYATLILKCDVGQEVYVKRTSGTATLGANEGGSGNISNFGGYLLG